MGWIIERGMVPVNCKIAIFDLKGALAPQDKPLMLQPVLFCPVLTWAAQELMDCGVQRYFIVCPEKWRQEVLDDLPEIPGLEADGQLRLDQDGAVQDPEQ